MKIISTLSFIMGLSIMAIYADGPVSEPAFVPEIMPVVEEQAEELPEVKLDAIPKRYETETKAAIKLEGLKRDADGDYVASYRFINPAKHKISLYVFPDGTPKTKYQIEKEDKWVDPNAHAFVSANFRELTVDPGKSLAFTEELDGAVMPARIGIMCWNAEAGVPVYATIWSDPVER